MIHIVKIVCNIYLRLKNTKRLISKTNVMLKILSIVFPRNYWIFFLLHFGKLLTTTTTTTATKLLLGKSKKCVN